MVTQPSAPLQAAPLPAAPLQAAPPPLLEVDGLSIMYGHQDALVDVNLKVQTEEVLGIIGPANSGKTSFLKAINRMDLFDSNMKVTGTIRFNGTDTRAWRNVYALRRQIGVVFPLPVGLPMSVFDNVALAPRLAGIKDRSRLEEIVETCLRRAALWDEVKDRLKTLGSMLSGGQQQRLTIARALSQKPKLLMLDEFSIAVDPVTTMRIEEILRGLKKEMTIVMVTNLVQQAQRLADRTAFFLNGRCLEIGSTQALFEGQVKDTRTHEYITGRFG